MANLTLLAFIIFPFVTTQPVTTFTESNVPIEQSSTSDGNATTTSTTSSAPSDDDGIDYPDDYGEDYKEAAENDDTGVHMAIVKPKHLQKRRAAE
ncbi:unnamed protein product [Rodentolepis nana]|uniref:Secreted protein n=1 Tax=Rodentolepis nana TaxID=102285 RepID=A0A0R3TXL8_RODNA|nr:unnamed protein product [Rodentolepis nana]